ncbi:MAG: Alpha/Beta hydrolase protein [Lentinula lateritia]|nr:MAG: Alpha/Beta hydrolase protein [Lentinula lateritia]
MPFAEVTSSTGKTKFKYTISTPNSEDAEQIDAGLPTIVFFHPVFLAEHVFQAQFSDQRLRQYNLVSFDCRGHGKTTGDPAPEWYGHVEAAEDTIHFMALLQNLLNLPPCHLVGVSSAANTILKAAVMEPERVLSMFLVSPVCLEVPTEVAEGHHEIKDLWTSAFPDDQTVLKELIYDAEFGEKQFLFSELQLSSLSSAMWSISSKTAEERWCHPFLHQYRVLTHGLKVNCSSQDETSLARITCPVKLIHGVEDVAFSEKYYETFLQQLLDAGVDASLSIIDDAPHCMVASHPKDINPQLYDFVKDANYNLAPPLGLRSLQAVNPISPWDGLLKEAGWEGEDDAWDESLIIYKYGRSPPNGSLPRGSLDNGDAILESFLEMTELL